jgi:polysaccharide pyruvyl transferase WcaK-like protein
MIYHVFANKTNIGDWLSARGIQSLLKPLELVELLCDEPFVPATLEVLSEAKKDDFVIIGGGGLFMDYFQPFWEGFQSIAERVPYCIWGVGYCDMKRELSRPPPELLDKIVRQSRLCVLRDEMSRHYLNHCQLPPAVSCPSMAVVNAPSQMSRGLLYADAYDNIGKQIYDVTVESLIDFSVRTGRNYRQINNTIPRESELQLDTTLGHYASADLIVSSRLHGCILGIAMGRKVLAISGDHKVESFMRSAGLAEWVLDIEEIDHLTEHLSRLHTQKPVQDFVDKARRGNHAVARELKGIISRQPPNRSVSLGCAPR